MCILYVNLSNLSKSRAFQATNHKQPSILKFFLGKLHLHISFTRYNATSNPHKKCCNAARKFTQVNKVKEHIQEQNLVELKI